MKEKIKPIRLVCIIMAGVLLVTLTVMPYLIDHGYNTFAISSICMIISPDISAGALSLLAGGPGVASVEVVGALNVLEGTLSLLVICALGAGFVLLLALRRKKAGFVLALISSILVVMLELLWPIAISSIGGTVSGVSYITVLIYTFGTGLTVVSIIGLAKKQTAPSYAPEYNGYADEPGDPMAYSGNKVEYMENTVPWNAQQKAQQGADNAWDSWAAEPSSGGDPWPGASAPQGNEPQWGGWQQHQDAQQPWDAYAPTSAAPWAESPKLEQEPLSPSQWGTQPVQPAQPAQPWSLEDTAPAPWASPAQQSPQDPISQWDKPAKDKNEPTSGWQTPAPEQSAPKQYDVPPKKRPSDDSPTVAMAYGNVSSTIRGAITGLSGDYKDAVFDIRNGEEIIFGRDPETAHVVFDQFSADVSRKHMSVKYIAATNVYVVIDYSINGVFTNDGKRLEKGKPTALPAGTAVVLGDSKHSFRLG